VDGLTAQRQPGDVLVPHGRDELGGGRAVEARDGLDVPGGAGGGRPPPAPAPARPPAEPAPPPAGPPPPADPRPPPPPPRAGGGRGGAAATRTLGFAGGAATTAGAHAATASARAGKARMSRGQPTRRAVAHSIVVGALVGVLTHCSPGTAADVSGSCTTSNAP